jgi:5'(3')-deoxyribonucleotidase
LLDVDGVLADFIGGALQIVNDLFGTAHVREDVTQFDIAASLGLTAEQGAVMKRAIGAMPRFAGALRVLDGAVEAVRQLHQIAEIYIVTSPWNSNPTWCHDREAWLDRHFGILHARVIHTSAKHLVAGDILVDDKTSTLEQWRAAHPIGIAVQWATPHNRCDAWDGASTSSWDELIAIVRSATP